MKRTTNYFKGVKMLVFVLVIGLISYLSINAGLDVKYINNVTLQEEKPLTKDSTHDLSVDYEIKEDYVANDSFTLLYPKEIEGVESEQRIKVEDKEIATCLSDKKQFKCTFNDVKLKDFKDHKATLSPQVKVVEKISEKQIYFKTNAKQEFAIETNVVDENKVEDQDKDVDQKEETTQDQDDEEGLPKSNESIDKQEDAKKENDKAIGKEDIEKDKESVNKPSTSKEKVDDNKKKSSVKPAAIEGCDATSGQSILDYPNHTDELFDLNVDGTITKSIFNKVSVTKNGNELQDGEQINIKDQLVIKYNFKIGNLFANQIKKCDYYTFKLPSIFKINKTELTGKIVDRYNTTKVYGEYTIDANGNGKIVFTDLVNKESNVIGELGLSVYIDEKNIIIPGEEPIKLPYVGGDKETTIKVGVEDKQLLNKGIVSFTDTTQIKDNKADIRWKVLVNPYGFKMSDPVVLENLPQGMTLKNGGNFEVLRYKVKPDRSEYDTTYPPLNVFDSKSLYIPNNSEFTYVVPNIDEDDFYAYEIHFDTTVDFNILYPIVRNNQKVPQVDIVNTAKLTSKEYEDLSASASKTYQANHKVEKKLNTNFNGTGYKEVGKHADGYTQYVYSWKINFMKDTINLPGGKDGNEYITYMTDILTNMVEFTDSDGVGLTIDQLSAELTKQFQTFAGNESRTIEVVKVDANKYTLGFPQGIGGSFSLDMFTLTGGVNATGVVGNEIRWNGKDSGSTPYQPERSTGTKYYMKPTGSTMPTLENGNEMRWIIDVNKERIELDSFYITDTLTNSTLTNDGNKCNANTVILQKSTTGQDPFANVDKSEYEVNCNPDFKGFKLEYNPQKNLAKTSDVYRVVVRSTIDPSAQNQTVKNTFDYHYITKGYERNHTGDSQFVINPTPKESIEGTKQGTYLYDSKYHEDKIKWIVTINDARKQLGSNYNLFYDHIGDGQAFDNNFKPILKDDQGNVIQLQNAGTTTTRPYFEHVAKGSYKNHALYPVNSANNKNGTLLIHLPLNTSDQYTIEFQTIVTAPIDKTVAEETFLNVAGYVDNKVNPFTVNASTSFTRNERVISKTHTTDPNDVGLIHYTVETNKKREKLENIVITDEGWQYLSILEDSVVVQTLKENPDYNSSDPNSEEDLVKDTLIKNQDYTVERTQSQMIIRMAETSDKLRITYDGRVMVPEVNQDYEVVNMVNIVADKLEGGKGEISDGFVIKIPDSYAVAKSELAGFNIVKKDSFDAERLNDAEFDIYQAHYTINSNGEYEVTPDSDGTIPLDTTYPIAAKNQVTKGNGEVLVKGLKLGVYIIHETKAPINYKFGNYTDVEFRDPDNPDRILKGKLVVLDETNSDNDYELAKDVEIDNDAVVKVNVLKKWNDEDNINGFRPDEVYVQLKHQYGLVGQQVKLKEDPITKELTYEWDDLAKYIEVPSNPGVFVKADYTVEEVNLHPYYETTEIIKDDSIENVFSFTLTNSLVKTERTVQKEWYDNHNILKHRPTEVKVQLYANGKEVEDEKVLNEKNGWKYHYQNLDYKDQNNDEIVYTTKETTTHKYYEENTTDPDLAKYPDYTPGSKILYVRNYMTYYEVDPEYVETRVDKDLVKTWKDNNDGLGDRPTSVMIQLYVNDKPYLDPIELNEKNGWKHEFKKLPGKVEGVEQVYTIRELDVDGNYKEVYNLEDKKLEAINTHKDYEPPKKEKEKTEDKVEKEKEKEQADSSTYRDLPQSGVVITTLLIAFSVIGLIGLYFIVFKEDVEN